MNRQTIITYHSLEASGSSRNPTVRSQNLSDGSFSQGQHKLNEHDHAAMRVSDLRGRGYAYDDSDMRQVAIDPAKPFIAASNPAAYTQQAGRVLDHVSILRGAGDRIGQSVDDTDLERRLRMFRSAPRATYGRDADLTVVGEAYLDDSSYTNAFAADGFDARRYAAQNRISPNGKTSNGFSIIDGHDTTGVNFSSMASVVGGGQSFLVMAVNGLVVGFVHTPNAIAKIPKKATAFYEQMMQYNPDIIMGDTNTNTSIAAWLKGGYREYPRSMTPVFSRPADFTITGTNSSRTQFYDQIIYNANTVDIESARYIPSDVSGATMSDHFGLIVCARKKSKRPHSAMDEADDIPSGSAPKRRKKA